MVWVTWQCLARGCLEASDPESNVNGRFCKRAKLRRARPTRHRPHNIQPQTLPESAPSGAARVRACRPQTAAGLAAEHRTEHTRSLSSARPESPRRSPRARPPARELPCLPVTPRRVTDQRPPHRIRDARALAPIRTHRLTTPQSLRPRPPSPPVTPEDRRTRGCNALTPTAFVKPASHSLSLPLSRTAVPRPTRPTSDPRAHP